MITMPKSRADAPPVVAPERRVTTAGSAHLWPRLAIAAAALLLGLATLLPFWTLTLHAPQYPKGLSITLYTQQVTGDVAEVDGLNHYIGMMKLANAAVFERRIAKAAIAAIVVLGLVAAALRHRLAALLAIPIIAFPLVFVADLFYWLYRAGHELDRTAALSTSIKPFTPRLLGLGRVGQFSTTAQFDLGFYLALLAAVIALVGIVLRFRRGTTAGPQR